MPGAAQDMMVTGAVGNTNALKNGIDTKAALEEQRALRQFMREMEEGWARSRAADPQKG